MKFPLDILRPSASQKYFVSQNAFIQKYLLQYQTVLKQFCSLVTEDVHVSEIKKPKISLKIDSKSLDKKKRTRIKFKEDQLEKLEEVFKHLSYPDVVAYENLASKLSLTESQVKIWFKNRRSKWRKSEASFEIIQQLIPSSGGNLPNETGLLDLSVGGIIDNQKDCVKNLLSTLKGINIDSKQILKQPQILALGSRNIEERYYSLQELGFLDITVSKILSFSSLIRSTTSKLHEQNNLPSDVNPLELLISHIDCPPDFLENIYTKYPAIEDKSLFLIKNIVFREYVSWFFKLSSSDISSFLEMHSSIKYRSITNIFKMWNVLKMDFKFPVEKIRSNRYILLIDPLNLRRMLNDFKEIAGVNIYEFVKNHPRITFSNCNNIKEVEKILRENNISSNQILKCPNIYNIDSNTIQKRLKDFQKFEEYAYFKYHPRFLCLIEHYSRSKERMHYLKSVGFSQISINLLIASKNSFLKWCSNINMHFTPKECIQVLANMFGKSFEEISSNLRQHPKSLGININNIKTVKIIKDHGFSDEQIYCALPLILYEPVIIKQQLKSLPFLEEIQPYDEWTSRLDALHVVIYLIEQSYGFTWEGVQSSKIKKIRQEIILENFEPHITFETDSDSYNFCTKTGEDIVKLVN